MGASVEALIRGMRSLLTWWLVVTPWEQAVRVRAGKRVAVLDAGLHLRIPLVDRFFMQSTRRRISDLPIQTLTTADGKTITLKGQLGYRITDILNLYETLDDAEGTLVNMAQAAIAERVVGADRSGCEPRDVGRAVTRSLADPMVACGLRDVRVTITDFADVKTYRLITQDIWYGSGPHLNTRDHHTGEGMPL